LSAFSLGRALGRSDVTPAARNSAMIGAKLSRPRIGALCEGLDWGIVYLPNTRITGSKDSGHNRNRR
jgi:hypothetical protein